MRGQRYAIHQIPHLSDLLHPHDDVLIELFNIGVKDFRLGIEKLQLSLMKGLGDAKQDLEALREKTLPLLEQLLHDK